MKKEEALKHAQETGAILKVAYKAGSQPNHAREIIPLKIENDQVLAKCLTSNTQKRFFINRLELLSDRKYRNQAKWDPNFIAVTDYEKFKMHKVRRKRIGSYFCVVIVILTLAAVYLHIH